MKKLYKMACNETYLVVVVAALVTVLGFHIARSALEFLAIYFAGVTSAAAMFWLIEEDDDEL